MGVALSEGLGLTGHAGARLDLILRTCWLSAINALANGAGIQNGYLKMVAVRSQKESPRVTAR